jgi:hypothetical protein
MVIKVHFSVSPLSLLLLCFCITFFLSIDIGIAPQTTQPLCNYLERRTQGNSFLLTVLFIIGLPWLTFAFYIIARFFLARSNWMTTNIDSLAAGLDVHAVRLGIGCPVVNNTFCTDVHLFPPSFSWSCH